MKTITLLCCINSSNPSVTVRELEIYSVLNKVAPIKNIKLFNTHGQIKAFVQVASDIDAQNLIFAFNNVTTDIGRFKVFISYKKSIVYDKPLTDVLYDALNSGSPAKTRHYESSSGIQNTNTCNVGYPFKTSQVDNTRLKKYEN